MKTLGLTEMQNTALNQLTTEFRFWLRSIEVAEHILANTTDSDISASEIEGARSIFSNVDHASFEQGVTLARLTNLNVEISECGINDGAFFRSARERHAELTRGLSTI